MTTVLKVTGYFAVMAILMLAFNAVPHSEKEIRGLMAFLFLGWFFGGLLIVFRAIWRFITR